MIYQKIEFGTPLFDQAFQLRTKLLRIPLKLTFQKADIEKEWEEDHFGLLLPSYQLVGCLTMKKIDDVTYKMRQVAIESGFQGLGFGKLLVYKTEDWCRQNEIKKIVLNARDTAVPFYKSLAYFIVGEEFEEVGIKHFAMEKLLKNPIEGTKPSMG